MRHAYLSFSSSLPNMIKLSQTMWELWPAKDFGFRGDNYIMKIELSLLHTRRLLVLLYIPTIYHQSLSKDIKVMERTRMRLQYFYFRGDNSLLHGTRLLVLFFIPTKYYQIISNSMEVMACTRFRLQGDNYITKTVRVVFLACDAPTGPPLQSY